MPYCSFCLQPVPKLSGSCPHCKAFLGEETGDDDAAYASHDDASPAYAPHSLEQRVVDLVRQQRRLEAIKLYKEETGAALWEAKEAVEAIERGESVRSPAHAPATSAAPADAALEYKVVELLRTGSAIEAIKHYRGQTGCGLKEAKDAVDALAERHGLRATSSGCAIVLMVLAVVTVIGLGIAAVLLFLK